MPTTMLPSVTVTARTDREKFAGRAWNGTTIIKRRIKTNSRKAVIRFGISGQKYIRARAPVDTGYMKSKVGYDLSSDKMSVEVFVDGIVSTETGAFYAVYVEYGTRHMRAQPFFWPGIKQAQREFKAEMMKVYRR